MTFKRPARQQKRFFEFAKDVVQELIKTELGDDKVQWAKAEGKYAGIMGAMNILFGEKAMKDFFHKEYFFGKFRHRMFIKDKKREKNSIPCPHCGFFYFIFEGNTCDCANCGFTMMVKRKATKENLKRYGKTIYGKPRPV